ncbi:unnamed protein product [Prorocentrum cordatum]|uniref:Uncharacterized protein n=1 Tax=Prorocentrum cordatum TaxID=2364126 RepID=A0ABN9RBX0_9DINO|nr:unnamed protein product [Polarella glacialis]
MLADWLADAAGALGSVLCGSVVKAWEGKRRAALAAAFTSSGALSPDAAAFRHELPAGGATTGVLATPPLPALADAASLDDTLFMPQAELQPNAPRRTVWRDGACIHPADHLLARAAWGLRCDGTGESNFGGHVDGLQTAWRAEVAVVVAASRAVGDPIDLGCDSKLTSFAPCAQVAAGVDAREGEHADLLRQAEGPRAERAGSLRHRSGRRRRWGSRRAAGSATRSAVITRRRELEHLEAAQRVLAATQQGCPGGVAARRPPAAAKLAHRAPRGAGSRGLRAAGRRPCLARAAAGAAAAALRRPRTDPGVAGRPRLRVATGGHARGQRPRPAMGCGPSSRAPGLGRRATRVRDLARDGRFSEVVAQRSDDSIHIRLDQYDLETDCVSSVSAVTSLRSRFYASRSSTAAIDEGSVVAALDESIANMSDLQDIDESSVTQPDSSQTLAPASPCPDARFPGRTAAPATFIDSREHPLAPVLHHGFSFKSTSRTSCPSPRSGDPGTSCYDPSVRDDVSCTASALSVSTAPPERRPPRFCHRSDDVLRRPKESDHRTRTAGSKKSL